MNKFDKLYNKIIKETVDNKITIHLNSVWSDEDEVQKFTKKLQNLYNVTGEFIDGSDQNSYWKLTGTREDLRDAIQNEWCDENTTLKDIMDPDELDLLNNDYDFDENLNKNFTTVNASSCWMDKSDQNNFKTILKNKYNVNGTFNDKGENHSYWTLTGDRENLKKVMSKFSAIFINN